MRRREFIAGVGATVAGPLAGHAQKSERVRRIGVLMSLGADDSEAHVRLTAFSQGMQEQGWSVGRNLQIDYRFGAGDQDRIRRLATELVALAPDVVLASGGLVVGALQKATRTVPIVFVQVSDPVGAGFVASLAHPSGNATGFTNFEYGMSAKWLEFLKQVAPGVTQAAVLRDPAIAAGLGQWGAIQSVAPSFGVELTPIDVRDAGEIESAIKTLGQRKNTGLIVLTGASGIRHRDQIIMLAARHRLPAVYPDRNFVIGGGLLSYGPDRIDQHRRAAVYVDQILKGEKPGDLPVQAPTKYQLVVNLKTANAPGFTVPPGLLARADEVIE